MRHVLVAIARRFREAAKANSGLNVEQMGGVCVRHSAQVLGISDVDVQTVQAVEAAGFKPHAATRFSPPLTCMRVLISSTSHSADTERMAGERRDMIASSAH
ncbi:hypothetical protein RRG08_015580 [Elysia crispata]|uniref:Uncharacterized protein n=1 Tax=Elysia crispata TaxID=231223 RepID=A0AAE0YIT3_9GAST|nr:hypothetical protein RRG08_015580 [Elysia crispata]